MDGAGGRAFSLSHLFLPNVLPTSNCNPSMYETDGEIRKYEQVQRKEGSRDFRGFVRTDDDPCRAYVLLYARYHVCLSKSPISREGG